MAIVKRIHDMEENVDGTIESLHFLLAELHSSQNVSKTSSNSVTLSLDRLAILQMFCQVRRIAY